MNKIVIIFYIIVSFLNQFCILNIQYRVFAKVLSTEETSSEKMTSLIEQSKAIEADFFKDINT